MMTGNHYFSMLTEEEQINFIGEFNVLTIYNWLNAYLNSQYISFGSFISCAFVWMQTEQGYKYWESIADRYEK